MAPAPRGATDGTAQRLCVQEAPARAGARSRRRPALALLFAVERDPKAGSGSQSSAEMCQTLSQSHKTALVGQLQCAGQQGEGRLLQVPGDER